MYILKNAFKNLGRNKGRNILLGIIIFTLIMAITVAMVINTTTKEIISDYKARFGSKVSINVDFDKLMKEANASGDGNGMAFPTAPEVSTDKYFAFAESEYLKSYKLSSSSGIILKDLKAIDEDKNGKSGGGMTTSIGNGEASEYVSPTAMLLANSDLTSLTDFANGNRKISKGEIYKNDNECIISSDFAKLNNLDVGSKIKIADSMSKDKVITLTISGIYDDATKPYGNTPEGGLSLMGSSGNKRNEIFVSMDTLSKNYDSSKMFVSAEFELNTPDDLEAFEKELREKGLPDAYNVTTDEASYNRIVSPVEGLSKISLTFMLIILVIGVIILMFITTMAIRERKYEIGVLRAMGMKKIKVAIMLITECVMITVICLGIGLFAGTAISQPVANTLIEGQIKAAEENTQNGMMSGSFSSSITIGGESENAPKPLSKIDVSLTPQAVLYVTLVALLLAFLSSIAGVIFITKYEPMKILSERN